MTIPLWTLLGFAGWTLMFLLFSIGVYRWLRIFTRRAELNEFRADAVEGADWYKRAMRAHANCVENLPVFGAIVLVAEAAGIRAPILDILAIVVLSARIPHTLVHVALEQTNVIAGVRFAFFLIQYAAMLTMGGYIAIRALG